MYDRNEYLIEHYGITAERYAEMMIEQGGVCKCCGQAPTGRPLHVDHCHAIARLKFKVVLVASGIWAAAIPAFNTVLESTISLKDAKIKAKRWLLAKSVRGLVCWRCNAGLQSFKESPENLRSAAKYLDSFRAMLYSHVG